MEGFAAGAAPLFAKKGGLQDPLLLDIPEMEIQNN